MHTFLLVVSALAMGALAIPPSRPKVNVIPDRPKVNVVTETEFVYLTVTVFVTIDPTPAVCVTSTPLSPQVPRPINSVKTPVAPPPAPTLIPKPAAQPPQVASIKPTPIPTPSPRPSPQPNPNLPSLPLVQFSTTPARPSQVPPQVPTPIPPQGPPQVPSPVAPQIPPQVSSKVPQQVPSPIPSTDHLSGQYQAYLSTGQEYQNAILYHHNAARANHGAGPLVWDKDCEANALLAARRCTFQHYIPPGVRQGQNLFTVSGDAFNVTAGITESWYKSELGAMMPWFGQPDVPDDVFHNVGHLTQLVWKDTTGVGCVSVNCGNFMMVGGQVSSMNKYTVCNYAPAGNIGGDFARNVAAPISLANTGGWAD